MRDFNYGPEIDPRPYIDNRINNVKGLAGLCTAVAVSGLWIASLADSSTSEQPVTAEYVTSCSDTDPVNYEQAVATVEGLVENQLTNPNLIRMSLSSNPGAVGLIRNNAAQEAGLTIPKPEDVELPPVVIGQQPQATGNLLTRMMFEDEVTSKYSITAPDFDDTTRAEIDRILLEYFSSHPSEVTVPHKIDSIHVVESILLKENNAPVGGFVYAGVSTDITVTASSLGEDIMAHETAHKEAHDSFAVALAPCDIKIMGHRSDENQTLNAQEFITPYAATNPAEDFAETVAHAYDPIKLLRTSEAIMQAYPETATMQDIEKDPRLAKLAIAMAFLETKAPGFIDYSQRVFDECMRDYAACLSTS